MEPRKGNKPEIIAAEMPSSAVPRSPVMSTCSSTSRSLIVPGSESNLPRSAQARTSSPPGNCRAPSGHAAVSRHVTLRGTSFAGPAQPRRGRNEARKSVHANTGWQVGVPKNLERGIRVCFGSFPSFRVERECSAQHGLPAVRGGCFRRGDDPDDGSRRLHGKARTPPKVFGQPEKRKPGRRTRAKELQILIRCNPVTSGTEIERILRSREVMTAAGWSERPDVDVTPQEPVVRVAQPREMQHRTKDTISGVANPLWTSKAP